MSGTLKSAQLVATVVEVLGLTKYEHPVHMVGVQRHDVNFLMVSKNRVGVVVRERYRAAVDHTLGVLLGHLLGVFKIIVQRDVAVSKSTASMSEWMP